METLDVNDKLKEFEIPCDAIWLDIEYSNMKKYFTWDTEAFPNAKRMLEKIKENFELGFKELKLN